MSFKILCSKHCALHEVISVKPHYNEISTIIHTIDEETEAYREVKETATPVHTVWKWDGCDVDGSITRQLYLGKQYVYVWPVADLGQKPGGANFLLRP